MRSPNPPRRRSSGLTLIELAVVIALIATLASLALPSFADHLARQRVRAAAESLLVDLQEARFAAAERQQAMHVTLHAGADWCWAVAAGPACDCRVQQACRVKAVGASQFKGVELTGFDPVHFEPSGLGGGRVTLRSSRGHELRAEVGPTGRPRLCAVRPQTGVQPCG